MHFGGRVKRELVDHGIANGICDSWIVVGMIETVGNGVYLLLVIFAIGGRPFHRKVQLMAIIRNAIGATARWVAELIGRL